MNAGAKLGLSGLLLAVALGGGAALGAVVGPLEVGGADVHPDHPSSEEPPAMTTSAPLPAGGLLVTQDGTTFEPESRVLGGAPFAFAITGDDGTPVRDYEELHERELHLIVASRDLRSYAHVHPARDAAGRWSVDLPDLPPGAYRAFADLQPAGATPRTLGIDVAVPGAAAAPAPLAPSDHDVVDGLEVHLDAGDDGTATVTVRRDGQVVTTDPYLGAAGHLVALRDGDLAYLHVHPLDEEPAGPVRFAVEYPSAGTYALFFDFSVDGVVRTARFVVEAGVPAASGHGHGTADGHGAADDHGDG